ncbi:RmlC-like jelly roll fold [Sesbania bispinosa]|nr:RmlC-like jelly roll fold [Sesbania bispinosa]
MSLPPLVRRRSSGEIRNLTTVSSSLLPAFGTTTDELALVVYSAWASPFELAFREMSIGPLLIADLVVDVFFAVDIVLTFFVAYLDKSTYFLVDNHKKIATRYVKKLHFAMDLASTVPFQQIYQIITGKPHRNEFFAFLNLLRLWRLRRVSQLFSSSIRTIAMRDAFNKMLQYASKSRLPEGLKEQMLAHLQLKFKTAELQQEEVLQGLPKAIRSSIAQHLFHNIVANAYLFNGVSDDFVTQLVSEMKAEYYPSKVDIILQNEVPAYFYILVSGSVLLFKQEPGDMVGEIGVMLNIPQPYTVRSRRLSQVIRISHQHFKEKVQPFTDDGKAIISNFIQGLNGEVLEEIPCVTELLGDLHDEHLTQNEGTHDNVSSYHEDDPYEEGRAENSNPVSSLVPVRVKIYGHHPNENKMGNGTTPKLILLPNSVEDLFKVAELNILKKQKSTMTR